MESNFFKSQWSREVVDELARLVDQGKSAQQIARVLTNLFGGSFSRNAVCSKCNRTGLQLKQPCRGKTSTSGKVGRKKRIYETSDQARPPRVHRPGYRRDIPYVDEPTPAGDTSSGCRWMHSEDPRERIFCGAEIYRRHYCQHHYARATTEPPPKKAKIDQKRADWLSRT